LALAAVAALCGTAGLARASALVDVSILAEDLTRGENTFSSSLTVKAGDTINYEVLVEMAPLTTTSSDNHTITSLVSGTDGVTSLSFNLTDTSVTWANDFALSPVFNNGLASNGTTTPNTGVSNAFGSIAAAGSPQGVAAGGNAGANVVLGTGSFVVGSGNSSVTGSYGTINGGFKINNATFRPTVTSGDPKGYVGFASLDLTQAADPIISLTTAAPTGYGSSLGAIAITGSNGNYQPGVKTFVGTTSAYVAINTFSPATDHEVFALDVQGASNDQIAAILNDINNAGISGLSASLTGSAALAPLFTDGGTIVFLDESPGVGANPFVGINLTNDAALAGVTFTGVAAIPEPATFGLLTMGGLAFLKLRRRKATV
jgi:hypothetical protein